MGLWRKLTLDWPCMLGDFLWWAFVTAPKASLERLTLRRTLIFFAVLFLACLLAQIVTLDFAFFIAGDTVFYLEIASAVMLIAAKGHMRVAARTIMRSVRETMHTAHVQVRHRLGTRQRRNRRPRKPPPKSSDDEPAVAGWALA